MTTNYSFISLPLGSVKPGGWLLTTLKCQAEGLTGSLDTIEPRPGFKVNPVRGNSVWRGGRIGRDFLEIASERAPYYVRGLVATAYLSDNYALQEKAKEWLNCWFDNQNEEGNLEAPGVSNHEWWPRMLIIDAIRFYHEVSGDKRALSFISRYFHFQLNNLEKHPLTKNIRYLPEKRSWATLRGADNMASVAWLYDLIGGSSLLKLAGLLNSQTFAWEKYFMQEEKIYTHAVNLAQGLRKPAVQYHFWPEDHLIESSTTGLFKTTEQHGQVSGSISGDEQTSGRGPTAGAELCTTVEFMRSLQSMLTVFGTPDLADRIEKLAYNALPAAVAPDFRSHQYFSQANQVYCTVGHHGFRANRADPPPPVGPWYRDALTFGAPAGYQCCIYNFHLAWPLFISSMWMKRNHDTLTAMLYGPCRVTTEIKGIKVTVEEITGYPFSEEIKLRIYCERPLQFELSLRIPGWCREGHAKIGCEDYRVEGGTFLSLRRTWKNEETVTLVLPMKAELKNWPGNALTVERGPLVFALNPREKWFSLNNSADFPTFEVVPAGENPVKNNRDAWDFGAGPVWNYGLSKENSLQVFNSGQTHSENENIFPWNPSAAPIKICLEGVRLHGWQRSNNNRNGGLNAGPLPDTPLKIGGSDSREELTLIPYGAARLRISVFPKIMQ